MKKIEAIIRKTKFEDVKDALLEADIEWFSYYDVRGIGKARQGRIYRGVIPAFFADFYVDCNCCVSVPG